MNCCSAWTEYFVGWAEVEQNIDLFELAYRYFLLILVEAAEITGADQHMLADASGDWLCIVETMTEVVGCLGMLKKFKA
ncbi:hypothetical protein CEXT_537301 [Caerostris extrusa]|uniref:Uncharacterized protein n=1 Tax=Caerostris extrusa TaxID=172846 RepID=A0AAV4RPA5_CAEEX|nr:hypothetical protein CEXT_537301 [Caerostris extrusa]